VIVYELNGNVLFECKDYNLAKYGRAGQAKDDNMAHEICMLDTYGYKYARFALPLQKRLH
jgi:hypothetical protein